MNGIQEPVVTWNLFLTAILLPTVAGVIIYFISFFIRKGFDSFHAGWEKYEEEKEKSLEGWRTRFTENLCAVKNSVDDWRNKHTVSIEAIKTEMEMLNRKLPSLVTSEQCDESHSDITKTVDKHGNRITALEAKMENIKYGINGK